MAHGKRLFVGVQVSIATANALARCAEALARRARDANVDIAWVRPVNYHVTLKFLGWTRDDAVGAVRDHIAAALVGATSFRFTTARLGGFPSLDRASVLWAGIDPTPHSLFGSAARAGKAGTIEDRGAGLLGDLAARVDRATADLGFAAEQRPYHPHVTLGRLREIRPLRDVVLPMSEQMFSESVVDAVSLLESVQESNTYAYKEIFRIGFKTAEIDQKRQTEALQQGDDTDTDDGWSTTAREQHR